ncbi:hypothetical protein QRX12_15445 [Clostridioides difficile]|uniref:hypothetical protein n=1 Tax=Clostridioides difficile TaxID=1496 RepID=UPI00093EAAE7|nr:hypothetical protein [Clostridioides difficile]EGT4582865.1 hypothetical protein [Clostridioides difficile]EGT4635775.1 hypothetical protein [Clostridioides difficile]EGT5085739.1 hypothetical protein [Clostridioides difficile]EGT5157391.1 hypothetical protein [Clostridioides difficile]EGT5456035.1 hypothetical protein [Clostridioides difficile]
MKKIANLNKEELKIIWEKNSQLREDVRKACEDNDMYWIDEILCHLNKSLDDWSIGFYNDNYIKIEDNHKFLLELKSVCEKFSFLSEEEQRPLEYAISLIDKLHCMDFENKRFNMLENKINNMVKKLEEKVIEEFNKMTEPLDKEYLLENFIEFYVEAYLNDNEFYIDNEYVLYEKIIKSYA